MPLAKSRRDQPAPLRQLRCHALGGRAGIVSFCQHDVVVVPALQKSMSALFHPAVEVPCGNQVGTTENIGIGW